jgi:hypothetical protein
MCVATAESRFHADVLMFEHGAVAGECRFRLTNLRDVPLDARCGRRAKVQTIR